jgi:hypothetical protein
MWAASPRTPPVATRPMDLGLTHAVFASPHRGLHPVFEPMPREEVGEMRLDGLLLDPQSPRDLLVAETADEQRKHVALSWRELRHRPLGAPAVDERGGCARRQRRLG